MEHDVCDSVNYKSSDSSCEFNTHRPSGLNPVDIVSDSQWVYWNINPDLILWTNRSKGLRDSSKPLGRMLRRYCYDRICWEHCSFTAGVKIHR